MSETNGTLAVIIGRAGSKGLPGKNARILAGRPMICHTIEDALESRLVDQIVVSTDGESIANAARAMGVQVIDRPAELATDSAPVDAAVRHASESIDAPHDTVVVLYANVPVRPSGLIDEAVEMLRTTGADSIQSYSDVGKHHPYWMVELDAEGRVSPHVPNRIDRRQDLPRLLLPDGGVIAVTRKSLFHIEPGNPHAFLGRDRRGLEVLAGTVVDVDTADDLAVAAALLQDQQAAEALP